MGIFKLTGIPAAPRGIPKINVTFQLDVNGLLSVSAREEQSGQEQSIKIEGASVKRFIGCKYDEIQDEVTRISYKVRKDENGNIKIKAPILNKEFSPEEISASVLKN